MAIHVVPRLRSPYRAAGFGALFVLVTACAAVGQPGAAPTADVATDAPAGSGPTALDGTISYMFDASSASGGATTESHEQLKVTVHLVGPDDEGYFNDSGSTYTYSRTDNSHDPQTKSSCGLDIKSTAEGGGSFGPDGKIFAGYGRNTPEAILVIHAPYDSVGSSSWPCNHALDSTGKEHGVTTTECDKGGTGSLEGTISPGDGMAIAPGQVLDFACNVAVPIGTGSIVVKGTLVSR